MAYRSTIIKSIQRGTISIAAAAATNTATITAVDPNYAVVLYGGATGDSGTGSGFAPNTASLVLTNATTVTATVGSIRVTDAGIFPYQVIEYYPFVLRSAVQRGTMTMATGDLTKTATITAVTTSKSMLIMSGFRETSTSVYSTATPDHAWFDLVLTNSTTITAARTTSGTFSFVIPYQVVEFR